MSVVYLAENLVERKVDLTGTTKVAWLGMQMVLRRVVMLVVLLDD
jgi:hypothetical protein